MNKKTSYNHTKIEAKWQKRWLMEGIYTPDLSKSQNKFYNLYMFPYPSAEGLHAGHAFSSTGSDVFGRFMRMNGKNVFQPMGYDSFGIHAENYAIKTGEQPQTMLSRTIPHFTEQFKSLGHGYDWTRTVTTSDVDYYRLTQWLFVEMFKAGLAYRKKVEVNWCPSCKTVLADEQVMSPSQASKEPKNMDGTPVFDPENARICERCATVVERKDLEQWLFRITDYADRLLEGLPKIDWPEKIKTAQKNWIGKKVGINITYSIKETDETITVWTSRPDTNFGATFIVVAPEYAQANLVKLISSKRSKEVNEYIKNSLNKSKEDRMSEGREKTGVFTGLFAINQLNGDKMPIWVSDFVLTDVGTGAVVGVPGHDKRDFAFAKKFDLPVVRVVVGSDHDESEITRINQVQEEEGTMVNPEFLDSLDIHGATIKMMDYLERNGWGKRVTTYHLRDWLISRQRYWGPPIPMIYCEFCAKNKKSYFTTSDSKNSSSLLRVSSKTSRSAAIFLHRVQNDWDHFGWWPEENLPVELPAISDYKPEGKGRGPLANHPEFYKVACPECGETARRETDVSDTFLDSSWYFLRYPSVGLRSKSKFSLLRVSSKTSRSDFEISRLPWNPEITKNWLPADLYFGGAEHAVLHLMYARFVTMVLHDLKYLEFEEPFPKFYAHGLLIKDGSKMSKSRGNVINPDLYIEKFGADALRLYLMFLGPMDATSDFRDTGIEGMKRFVDRLMYTFTLKTTDTDSPEVVSKLHKTVKKVTEDMAEFRYNTSIAAMMELVNLIQDKGNISKSTKEILAKLIAPFAPHLAEEVWVNVLGNSYSIHTSRWPKYDKNAIKEKTIEIVVQVNGKFRGTVVVDANDAKNKGFVIESAKNDKSVAKWLEGKEAKKIIFVPGKIINFVI